MVRIADEPVRQPQAAAIGGTAGTDAPGRLVRPAQILHRQLRAGCDDLDAHTASNRTAVPGDSSAAGTSRRVPEVVERRADELPAARAEAGIDPGELAGQRDRALRHVGARGPPARHLQPLVAAGQEVEAGASPIMTTR